jgi:SAM-dependent methyltransferase
MTVHAEPSVSGELLACPSCRRPLLSGVDVFRCNDCDADYPIVDGVPVLVPQGAEAMDAPKARQAAFFDLENSEFEVSRPHGAPALYQHLLAEKFRRGISKLGPVVSGGTALVVCGGSGMDAEFLARAGTTVVSSDISLGAAGRVRERARRYGFAVAPVVADAERLPFRDRSFDLVYVHDGLHHLERPFVAIAEMARIAKRAVSITEPASATITAAAVRLGLALAREEAGNEVKRFRLDDVGAVLRGEGFRIVEAGRYAMYYRHHPGRVSELASRPAVFPAVEITLGWLDAMIGRFGNKLTVQALRD